MRRGQHAGAVQKVHGGVGTARAGRVRVNAVESPAGQLQPNLEGRKLPAAAGGAPAVPEVDGELYFLTNVDDDGV